HQPDNPLLLDLVKEFIDVVLSSGQQDSLTLQISRNQFYLQEEKFVVRTQNLALMQEMLHFFQQRSLPGLLFHPSVREADAGRVIAFAQMLNQSERMDEPLGWLQGQLQGGDYPWVEIVFEADTNLPGEPFERGERGRWAYSHSLTSIQEVADKLTSQRRAGVHKAKRMVQNMVDLLIEDDSVLLGMSTIRDYDDYTYTHSVNVAILSMCLGKRIGLSRISMERLGICGLFHDIGKVEVPHELIIKPGTLTDEEYNSIKEHSINSVRQIVKLNAARDLKASVLLPPFEHHLKYDLTGYPQTHRKKPISLFGRILTITDVFDAMTSPRIYRKMVLSPDRVLAMMMEGAGTEFDPLILKVFIQMLGVYPVGTLLLLDTGEMSLVTGVSGNTEVGRPLIVLLKENGTGGFRKGEIANLSETDPHTGAFRRNITRSLHPSSYGIQPADFLI
ncbi:MAG: HD-GYP domain-containing protein, partial [Syntrophales bacterium]|nr:HD-GYP domain-containing protein [Syntrophales bacterium]